MHESAIKLQVGEKQTVGRLGRDGQTSHVELTAGQTNATTLHTTHDVPFFLFRCDRDRIQDDGPNRCRNGGQDGNNPG